jgi:hypothetical protein
MNIKITKDQNPKAPRTFWIDGLSEPRVIYRSNFEGKEITDPNNKKRVWNPAGNRNFCFVVPNEYVDDLIARRWPIKKSKAQNEGEEIYYVAAKVKFRTNPYTGRGEPELFKFYGLEDRNPIVINDMNAADLDKQTILGARLQINESKDTYVTNSGDEFVTLYLNYGEFYVQESNIFKARWYQESGETGEEYD